MLISTWLTAVRNRFQTPRIVKRRLNQKQAAQASENLETRALLTTTLQAVRPNVGEFFTPGEIRTVAPQELTLQFSLGSTITPSSITNQSIQVFRSGDPNVAVIDTNADPAIFDASPDLFANGQVPVTIGYVGVGNSPNEIVLRFGENLPDDHYKIVVRGTGTQRLQATTLVNGVTTNDPVADAAFEFELDLGTKILAVDPQPVTVNVNGSVTQARNQIVIYFNDDDLSSSSAQNPAFYQLIFTDDTVSNLDDVTHNPSTVVYSSTTNTARLTFASNLDQLAGAGAGTFRLRVGDAASRPQAPQAMNVVSDPGDSFQNATSIGFISNTGNQSHLLNSGINPQAFNFTYPGANTDPGNREIEVESHLLSGADTTPGTSQIDYNFQSLYGFDPLGNALLNVITTAQKERAREVFEIYSNLLGIDFRETDSAGLTIATGDLRALDPTIPTGPGGVGGLAGGSLAIMDQAETWDDNPGASWFETALHEIGHLIGLGHNYELPPQAIQGSNGAASPVASEPQFPGNADLVHGRHLHRPDSNDIDIYRFAVATGQSGVLNAEVMAERLANASRLDSVLRLYRENSDGSRELISQNNDYFSEDSFLSMKLTAGTYFIGISSVGNEVYDPTISGTGIGGTSQGSYQLRLDFRPDVTSTLVDTTGTLFDGDGDGKAGGAHNFWFRAVSSADTLFVNRAAGSNLAANITSSATGTTITVDSIQPFAINNVIRVNNEQMRITAINSTTRTLTVTRAVNGTTLASHVSGALVRKVDADGSTARPFVRISDATSVATPGQIIRVVGNTGADGNINTVDDNLPYQVGFNPSGQALADGSTLEVPKGVTLMIDAGAVVKLSQALIGVGSSSSTVDRSGGALQVLGRPDRKVIFTSWNDETIGTDTTPTPTDAQGGDWGGIAFRDSVDKAQARFNYQSEGIFLNYVANADIRWGGGNVVVDSVLQTINAIFIDGAQPAIVNNQITRSNDSAISANPDSFEELTFHAPRFQNGALNFTSDYNRVGPVFQGNTLTGNSTNGLFVRVITPAGNLTQKLTVSGRFDDTDIVHVIAQNLEIQGTPGGIIRDQTPPAVNLITLTAGTGGTLAAGAYNYRIALTDPNGFEGPTSAVTVSRTVSAGGSITLGSLPPASGAYTGRVIYRSAPGGGGQYTLVAKLDRSATTFVDNGGSLGRTLTPTTTRDRARTDARLSIDAGTIVKLEGARIETEFGAQFIAEGESGRPVIFTSRLDDRYGAGGTFDTNNDDNAPTEATPAPGNWGGIYVGLMGSANIDRALLTFAGGIVPVGGNFAGFNPIEIHQAQARIRNTVFENNASGVGGTASANRSGLMPNSAGTIFIRSAQPVILNNDFRNNAGPGINANVNALESSLVVDQGRATGAIDRQLSYGNNQGPLVRDNRFSGNTLNGMRVRGETLTTQGVWDDTDIAHIVLDEIYVPDFHHFGGLRLESSQSQSLVVKLQGTNAGFTVNGYPLDIVDRIGGSIQIVGQPGQPVIMTSLRDDTVSSGRDLAGLPLKDTNGNGNANAPAPDDWRGIRIMEYAHDRNVKVAVENEQADQQSQDTNGTIGSAEGVGQLARNQKSGDENLRLGFEIHGFIDSLDDADIYSFSGTAGSTVWLDIDRTTKGLDSVVELLGADGSVIAISDNLNDVTTTDPEVIADLMPFNPLNGQDYYTLNQYDAGFRIILPGTTGSTQPYFVRVRSRSASPQPTTIGGTTTGVYQLQIRLQELDELPGTSITYADIRYADTGIEITGQPTHSPLAGESTEVEPGSGLPNATTGVSSVTVGNLMNSDRAALHLSGKLGVPRTPGGAAVSTGAQRENPTTVYDVDFWEFEVRYDGIQQIAGSSTVGPHIPVTIDLDFADGFSRADVTVAVYDNNDRLILLGRDSNISDDQPKPLSGADVSDLDRGSNGRLDPFIGPVELKTGFYRLAVFPNDIVPEVMNQYWTANPTSSLVRFEPVNSVQRVSEDRFDSTSGGLPTDEMSTALRPVTDLFNVTGGALDPKHIVPFHLGDVPLFVSQGFGVTGTNRSRVSQVDAFTGAYENLLGQFSPQNGDIAMRADGHLHTFSTGAATGAFSDGNVGNYLRIDTGTAAVTSFGDDGISTNIRNVDSAAAHDVGIQFNAMAYSGTNDNNLWAVGNRSQLGLKAGQTGAYAAQYSTNIIYQFNTATGDQVNPGGGGDRTDLAVAVSGAGTTQVEWGRIDTSFTNGGLNGTVTGMVALSGSQFLVVDSAGGLYSYNLGGATTFITNIGGLNINFAGLSFGPDEVEGGIYANTLFGVSATGRLYAFNTLGVLQPIFNDAATSVQIASVTSTVTGLAFGTLDYNPWQVVGHRGSLDPADDGHGIDVRPFDDSVALPVPGGNSLYFGNTRTGTTTGNRNTDGGNVPQGGGPVRNVDFPGGAAGTVVSNDFSLEGYSEHDKPTLYFNYFLDTENAQYIYGTNPDTLMRDSLRVFVADESGEWNLLVTNNSLQSATQNEEFDLGPDGTLTSAPTLQTFVDVVEAFDNTNGWRQARIDLSNYAGRAGLKLRFDFSTAGSMNVGDILTTGSELYAVPANELSDGDRLTIDNTVFEFDMGAHLTIPSGGNLEGRTFIVNGTTFKFTQNPLAASDILALPGESARTIAARANTVLNSVLAGITLNIPAANALEGESFTLLGQTFTYTATPLTPNDIQIVNPAVDNATTMAARTVARVNAVLGAGTAFINGSSVDFPSATTVTFGSSVNTAAGIVMEGETIQFNGTVFTFTATPLLATDIPISAFDSSAAVATTAVGVINTVLGSGTAFVNALAPSRISIRNIPNAASAVRTGGTLQMVAVTTATTLQGESITLNGVTFTFTANPTLATDILAQAGDTAATMAARVRTMFNSTFGTGTALVAAGAPTRVTIPVISSTANSLIRGGTLIASTGTSLVGPNVTSNTVHEFSLNGTTFRYTTDPLATGEILARVGDSATLIATRTAAAINSVLGAGTAVSNGNRISVRDLSAANSGFFLGGNLQLADVTATNFEGESFTVYGTTFTFRDPAAPVPLNTAGIEIDATAGDTGAQLAARVVAAINTAAGKTVAGAVGNIVNIAGAVSNSFGGTLQVVSAAAADLDGDTLNVNGQIFTFVGGAPGFRQIQSDANPAIVADRIVTALNAVFGAGTASNQGTVVSVRNDTTLTYNGGAVDGITILDTDPGTPMSFTRISNPTLSPLTSDLVNSPLGVDSRGTPLTFDAVGTTLSRATGFVSSYVSNNRITIPGATGIALQPGSPLLTSGGRGISGSADRAIPIFPNMTANQVATAVRQAIADEFAAGDVKIIKGSENRIQIIGHDVTDNGKFGFANSLPGDSFGAFEAGFVNGQATRPGSLRGMNNTVEGVYIDDIIIGFAERGEMITNAPATTAFILNRDVHNTARPTGQNYLGIPSGAYDVEIRRGTDFGESQTPSPTNVLYNAIDTNDREANGLALTLPAADQIPHNSTFLLSDGWRSVTFQFIDQYIGLGDLLQGNIPLLFNSRTAMAGTYEDNIELIATTIRNAINSQAVQDVLAVQAMFSGTFNVTGKTLHLTGNAILTPDVLLTGLLQLEQFSSFGDRNRERDQGQMIVQSSTIRDSLNFGIDIDAAVRTGLNPTAHPGAVKNTQEENVGRLITGIVIMNNVISGNAVGGVRFRGDTGSPVGAVPYGRILNNTLVGRNGAGTGIVVAQNASPTLLNNIVADFTVGINVDAGSIAAGTTIGATLYRRGSFNNVTGALGDGTFPIVIDSSAPNPLPLFVDAASGNFYPAPFSQAIDSSLNSLGDRGAITTVKSPLGLGISPILAPDRDVFGQNRGDDDDVATPAGQGANVFIDRGAIDRVDFFQPRGVLVIPEDQSSTDGDTDIDEVWIDQSQILREFRVRLVDQGIGIDGNNVFSNQFVLKRVLTDGVTEVTLVDGVDYTFVYDVITREAIFTAATFFADEDTEVRYILLVENDGLSTGDTVNGLRDLAGNYLIANKPDGTTRFDIVLTDGVNDAPQITIPTTPSVNEDTTLVLSNSAISIFDQDAHLGTNILTVSLTSTNGLMTLGSIPAGITFASSAGDGTRDALMTFTGKLQDLNAALNGLRFIPNANYFGNASITINVNDLGEFSGPAAVAQEVLSITVNPVNDAPTFNIPATAPGILEDAGTRTVTGFMTGQVAGPANESSQSISAQVTVSAENSAWTTANFFSVAPTINTTTGNLTYQVAQDVNGTATIRVIVRDSLGLPSAAKFFTITVGAVNDVPVYTRTPNLPVPSNEDSGLVTVDLINTFAAARSTALDEIGTQTLTWSITGQTRTSGNLVFDRLVVRPDGTLEYTPRQDTAGTYRLALNLSDGLVNASTLVITITVTQRNDAPVARTRNYTLDEGYSLVLDASASYDVDAFFGDSLVYAWDLDNNGSFETNAGSSPTLTRTWAQLAALGITAPASRTVRVRATDESGVSSIASGTLTTLIVDYGDAPNSYGTNKGSNGAAHTIAGGLQLGATRDKETNGQPNSTATGDGADEDGVQFPTTFETTSSQSLRAFVDVTSTAAGKLDAWLDLNQNGVFDHATEHLNGGTSWTLSAGVTRIFFSIPANTPLGNTMMRFRVSGVGSLLPTGRANTGEVEDYAVEILALQSPVTPTIVRPIDFNTSDGLIPLTTDSTPTVVWNLNLPNGASNPNLNYELIVRNAANQVVFDRLMADNLTVLSQTVNNELTNGNLAPGRYTISLRAFNKAGDASAVETYQFEVVALQIASPTGDVTTSRPVINWNHVAGSKTYTIQIQSTTNDATVFFQTLNVSGMATPGQFTMPSDLALGQYRVRVQATDAADLAGDWSAFTNFQVRPAPVVTGPASVVTVLRPTITWTPVPGAATYEVELFNLTDNVLVQRATGVRGASFVPASNLTLGKYRVNIRAFNSTGFAGVWSSSYLFNVAPVPGLISPAGLLNDSTPTFGWNAVPSADLYELVVRRDFGNFAVVYRRSELTGTIHGLTTPLPLGRYTWTIQAINNAAGSGVAPALSSTSVVTKFTVAEPPVITGPPATTFLSRPTITWVNPPQSGANAISELILDKKEGTATVRVLVQRNITGSSFTIPRDLQLGTYIVSVRTYSTADPATVSSWSITKTFRVTVSPTLIGPEGPTADATPTLNWNGVLGGQTYRVIVTSLSKNVVAYDRSGINALNFTVPSNLPIGRYRFIVQARSAFGDISDFSTPLDFQIVAAPALSGPSSSTFDTTPSFTWSDMTGTVGVVVAGATSYDFVLDRQIADGSWNADFLTRSVTTTSFTVPTTLPAGLYRAKVRAKSSDTVGNFSSYLEFYVGGRPVVNTVGNSAGNTPDTTPTISWQAVDGASGYDIFIALQSSETVAVIQRGGIGATSFTVPTALAKGAYRVWVRAVNGATGQFSVRSVAVDFTIVDASEMKSAPADSGYSYTLMPFSLSGVTSESTISMLPSFVSGSQQTRTVIAEQAVDADLQITNGAAGTAEVAVVVTEVTPQTDEVLSEWDQQKWWDSAPEVTPAMIVTPAEEKKEQVSASAGILGAILAFAPRSLRRRRKDESST